MTDEANQGSAEKREILLAIENLKSSVLAKLDVQDPLWLKMTLLALPVVLTSLLGLLVWRLQTGTQNALTSQQAVLSAQLGLKQYLYERRLDAYREIYDRLLATYTSLQKIDPKDAGNSAAKNGFYDEVTLLSNLANANRLIASESLNTLLMDAWLKAIRTGAKLSKEELTECVVAQMRRDLLMDVPDGKVERPVQAVLNKCNANDHTG